MAATLERPPVRSRPVPQRTRTISRPWPASPPQVKRTVSVPPVRPGFLASFSVEKGFTLLGFLVAAFLVLVFGADLAFGWPFLQASLLYDVNSVVCGIALAYLSWDVLRDQLRWG
jgi:hypothetical protein